MPGFRVAMNIWLLSVLMVSGLGVQIMSTLPYWPGFEWAWIHNEKGVFLQ